MAKPAAAIKELRKRLEQASKAEQGTINLDKIAFEQQLKFIRDPARFKTAVCSRRCLAEGTLVQTTSGPKPIETIKPGDFVYSEYGEPVLVKAVYENGIKPVVPILHNGRVLAESTADHVFLVENTHKNTRAEKSLKDFNSRDKIVRIEPKRNHGKAVPTAYAIGALLGDGCSMQGSKNRIYISSANINVPEKVANLLNASLVKQSSNNYTWSIQTSTRPEFYSEWCDKRKAHEKIADIKEILSWDRESRLQFIAGLFDTDGSLSNCSDGLQFCIAMQAKLVIDSVRVLMLDLWNYEPSVYLDNRDKYVNGPVYNLRLKHNYFVKQILKEISPYLVSPQKKWKPEYELKLENNYRPDRVGVDIGVPSLKPTYDIHVDSPTNLYVLANGLVTHNSGKSIACALDLLETVSTQQGDVAYITLNRRSAKKIIWRELLKYNKEFKLGGKADNTELTLTMPNGSVIHISGAKDESEAEKFRGLSLRKVYIDEAQSFRPYIKELIEDIIEPALTDYYGKLILIGTPGPIPAGVFYDLSHNPNWSHHHWTMQDNPHIALKSGQNPLDIIRELAERRGLTLQSPGIQREYFGQWVKDTDSLVYTFNTDLNITTHIPVEGMRFVFGVDIGWKDSDAIAVLGYSEAERKVFLVEEYVRNKSDITSLAEKIKELQQKYDPVKIVIDAGALGKKIQEEIRMRHGVTSFAAEKHRKSEFIALLNDDLRTGKFKALPNSRFEEDTYLLQWDYSVPEQPRISNGYHTDIGDAVLYAWRECRHFYEKTLEPPPPTPNQYMKELEEKEAEAMEASKRQNEYFTDVKDWKDLGISDDDYFNDF